MVKTLIFFLLWGMVSLVFASEKGEEKFQIELKAFPPGGGFTLDCAQGKCSLDDYRGKIVVLFFGYVSCPDICPTTLQQLQSAFSLLTPAEQRYVQIAFITLDPLRDTPDVLAEYLAFFKLPAAGLSGKASDIDQVVEQYAGQYRKVAYQGSALGYGIDHSAAIYLIDRTGRLRTMLRHEIPPAVLALTLRKLLAEHWVSPGNDD